MKHIFIVNPAAGKGKTLPAMLQRITYACKEHEVDYEIYHTATVGDATRYVAKKCRDNPDTEFRFYACGGDGTMNEVANGIVGMENAQLAVVPKGTGNDFVKIFSSPENFNNIGKIINRDHSTVLSSIEAAEKKIRLDPMLEIEIKDMIKEVTDKN